MHEKAEKKAANKFSHKKHFLTFSANNLRAVSLLQAQINQAKQEAKKNPDDQIVSMENSQCFQ